MKPLIDSAAFFLNKCGVPEAKTNAELLLAHVLQVKRTEVYLMEGPIPAALKRRFQVLVRERAKSRKPLAYLTGYEEFMGLRFQVLPKTTLIPRPETETLVETVLERLRAKPSGDSLRIMDVGAGTGCVGISLYKMLPEYQVHLTAVELTPEAAAVIRMNARSLEIPEERLQIRQGFFQDLKFKNQFDVIAANLPYIEQSDIKKLQPEIRLWEPPQALCGGPDGLILIRQLIELAQSWLKPGGLLALEFGDGQTGKIKKRLSQFKFKDIRLNKDLQGKFRVICAERE